MIRQGLRGRQGLHGSQGRRRRPIVPPFLQPGDPIAVVAASGVLDRRRLAAGVARLRSLGHPVRVARGATARHGYLAGTDVRRARALNAAIRDRGARAILFARGGYGMSRILPRLDLAALRRRPRLLMGYSDVTALFMALQGAGPYLCLYGPVVTELGEDDSVRRASLMAALRGGPAGFTVGFTRRDVTRTGRGTGIVIGGCLSLLVSLLGTPWDVSYDECILFWEDVGEAPYRIDRMLTQLRNAGKLDRLRGMLIGSTTGCVPLRGKPSLTLRQVVREVTAGARYPIVWNVKAGHLKHRIVLPLGARATIDTSRGTLTYHVAGAARRAGAGSGA